MPTIKTTGTGEGLRILTKTAGGVKRVSCSCCEEASCCPYPADQLGIGYTQDDLPDTIDVEGVILGVPERIIISRSGSFYGPINQTIFDGRAFSEFIFVETNPVAEVVWFRNITNGEPIGLGEPCLFQTLAEGSTILDTFADTYNIIYSDPAIADTTVTRESLCVWRGQTTITILENSTPYTVGLEYNSLIDNGVSGGAEDQLKWTVNGDIKIGTQNTPVGSYQSGDDTWTVFE